jgi:periplasmic mercuric ion binding protein
MNFSKSILVFAITSLVFVSCKKENTTNKVVATASTETSVPKAKTAIAPENLQTANFTVTGMTCAIGCAKTIEGNLSNLEGVQNAKVDFDKKMATVTYDKTIQSPEKLTEVVQATGDGNTYKVSNMKS